MKTYRITPIFILLFLWAAIALAYFIHRMDGIPTKSTGELSLGSVPGAIEVREPANASEEIQEIPREWSEQQSR